MQSLLVIAPQGFGDAIKATPLLNALRQAFPDARIDVLVLRASARELFSALPHIDEVIYLPFWERGTFAFIRTLLKRVRRRRYDASFLTYPAARWQYHLLSRLFGARRRFSHWYFPDRRSHLQFLETDLVAPSAEHYVLRNLQLAHAAGVKPVEPIRTFVSETWSDSEARRSGVAMHVGTVTHDGLDAKRWPTHRFEELANSLLARGIDVSIVCGPEERVISQALATRLNAPMIEGPLQHIARHLSARSAVIANDSGIAQLAAAVGIPVLALHGPTEAQAGPFGPTAIAYRPSPCPPCYDPRRLDTRCKLNIDYACLKRDLRVADVARQLLRLLGDQARIQPGGHVI
jgi:ADP-heptose:LPS heptosyltransferase